MQSVWYRPTLCGGFDWVQPVKPDDFDRVYQLDGRSLWEQWEPIFVNRLTEDPSGGQLARSEAPWLDEHALVLGRRALDAVYPSLGNVGEFLPLDVFPEEMLWLFNVLVVVDVLDIERSSLTRFPSTGRIMRAERIAFRSQVIDGLSAFRVPELRTLFVAQEVVDTFTRAAIKGACFEEVWPLVATARSRTSNVGS